MHYSATHLIANHFVFFKSELKIIHVETYNLYTVELTLSVKKWRENTECHLRQMVTC